MEQHKNSVCPICGQDYQTAVKLKNHIIKEMDEDHVKLAFVYEEIKIKCKDLVDVYYQYKDVFGEEKEIIVEKIKQKLQEEENRIEEEKNQKKLEQYKLRMEKMQMETLQRLELKNQEDTFFKSMPPDLRPKALVDFFYNKIKSRCFNYMIEIQLIKYLYKNGCTGEEIKNTIIYMANMGYANLRSLNYVINEALMFYENLNKVNEEGTVPNIIKYYYTSFKMKMNKKLFMKEVKAIQGSMNLNNLTIEEVKNVVNGMIKEKVKVLLWFDNYVSKYRNVSNNLNPCRAYSDEREVSELIEQLKLGKMKLKDIPKHVYEECLKNIYQIYKEGSFDSNYTHFEWAFKIGLSLNKELYKAGLNNLNHTSRFEVMINKYGSDSKKMAQINNFKNAYNEWFSKQKINE